MAARLALWGDGEIGITTALQAVVRGSIPRLSTTWPDSNNPGDGSQGLQAANRSVTTGTLGTIWSGRLLGYAHGTQAGLQIQPSRVQFLGSPQMGLTWGCYSVISELRVRFPPGPLRKVPLNGWQPVLKTGVGAIPGVRFLYLPQG